VLDPARQQAFVTSTIIGAITMTQLIDNLASHTPELDQQCLNDLKQVQARYPNRCP